MNCPKCQTKTKMIAVRPNKHGYAKPNIKFVFDHLTGEPKEVEILK